MGRVDHQVDQWVKSIIKSINGSSQSIGRSMGRVDHQVDQWVESINVSNRSIGRSMGRRVFVEVRNVERQNVGKITENAEFI
jgi:hypothetical protein